MVTTGRGGGTAFFFIVFTPLATNRAFRWTASYRSHSGRAKARNGNGGGKRCAASGEKRISYSGRMDTPDSLLERVSPALAVVPGVVAVVLGGSRARGAAHASSDTDIGLYFSEQAGLDVERLRGVVKGLVDEATAVQVTEIGGWGPWIVGGGWLTIGGQKVDLLYRPIESVERVIRECREGRVSMDYQPGHPHGFCSAIWMGEVALCRPLSDSQGAIARLKAMTTPYPEALCEALIRRFQWEILFSIENARTALPKGDATYIAGCGFRSLACAAQVLFAVNRRYVINEKGALAGAARLPLTVANLNERVKSVWHAIGLCAFDVALTELVSIEHELAGLVEAAR
jgi:predicted nucleotidyltransferase